MDALSARVISDETVWAAAVNDLTTTKADKSGVTQTLASYYTSAQTDTLLNNKVDKESGKGLSTNDFTTNLKNKLEGIASGAEVNVQADWNEATTTSDAYIKNKPTLGTAASRGVATSINNGENLLPSSVAYSGLAASFNYDSTAKKIYLKSTSGSVLSEIDATDFIKDGMVENVQISGSNLVITFNTDSGKNPISIPLSNIFNPNNYYTKSETSAKTEITTALQGKTDTATTASLNNVVTAHTANTTIHVTSADKTKLSGIAEGATKVESSSTNGNIKINSTETNVYTLPKATPSTLGGVMIDVSNKTLIIG